jgi:hypothetical protein
MTDAVTGQPFLRRGLMFPRTRFQIATFVAASVFVGLYAGGIPARAEEMIQHLGPVRAYEPILAPVGSKRLIAFYVPHGKDCAIHAIIWNADDIDANTASRIRVVLNRRQIAHIDSPDKSLELQCAHGTLAIVSVDP